MKTFIIAALTADGFIAKGSDHLSVEWTSKEDRKFFSDRTKKAGVVVMGLNTYKTIGTISYMRAKGKKLRG
jgi:dihydrofolate reductase